MLPRPDPLPARTTEETAGKHGNREIDGKDGKDGNGNFAILKSTAGIAVHIGEQRQANQRESRQKHSSDGWREVVQLLLQSKEIPGSLGRVWRQIGIGVIPQGSIYR